ncbi:hypothetical protein AAIB41_05425 [Brucella sp. BE17]|uniref:hypothetical protein n=1 Tax=Brucella sp. BE17 TaxID=3142977 RepID=UPI0031BAA2CC
MPRLLDEHGQSLRKALILYNIFPDIDIGICEKNQIYEWFDLMGENRSPETMRTGRVLFAPLAREIESERTIEINIFYTPVSRQISFRQRRPNGVGAGIL